MRLIFKQFLADETAATAVEYALIASGIAMAILVAVNSLGTAIGNVFSHISTSLK